MSDLFGDTGDEPVSLFAPVKAASKKAETEELPSLFISKPSTKAKAKKDTKKPLKKSSKKEPKKHNKKDSNPPPPPPQDDNPPPPPTVDNNPPQQQQAEAPKPKPKPKERKKIVKQVVVQRQKAQDIVKRTLNHMQNEITSQFDELFTIIESLQPKKVQQPPASLSNEDILLHVQELISDSMDKDRILQAKQVSIAKMTTTYTEREERSELRKKIADLMETISAESANTYDAQSEHEFRAKEVSRLTIELENIPKDSRKTEEKMRMNMSNELKLLREDFEKARRDCIDREKVAREAITFFREQIIADAQAKKGPTEADLRKAVQEFKTELRLVVQSINDTVEEYLAQNINQDRKYHGTTVRRAAQLALNKGRKRVLEPEKESDDEPLITEEEEDDEAQNEEEEEEANEDENEEENNEEDENNGDEEEGENEEENDNENEEDENENNEEEGENEEDEANAEEDGENEAAEEDEGNEEEEGGDDDAEDNEENDAEGGEE